MILVLQPDVEDDALARLRGELESLGCTFHASRGEEQVVVSLGGNFDPDAVHSAAAAWPTVDAVNLRSDRFYRAQRRKRRFMRWLIVGFGVLTVAALAFPVIDYLRPPELKLDLTGPAAVAQVDRFTPGSSRKLRLQGATVVVVRDQGGRFHAVSGDCTHLDPCQLEWNAERQQLLCPCHGGVFDVRGNVVDGPANAPLSRYETAVVGETLFVQRRR